MLLYVLICLSLSLTGVAGLQMMYMFYLESVDRQRKKHLADLEHECKQLRRDLMAAEKRIAEQKVRLESVVGETEKEAWADLIEEC